MKIKIEQVITDLKQLFELDNEENKKGASYAHENKFGIDKQHMERYEVIKKLQIYFKDKTIEGGYLEVGAITFVHTTFEVKEGAPS